MKNYDIRKRKDLLKEKRVFTTMMGEELDITFTPMIVTEMYSQYVKKQSEFTEKIPKYRKLIKEFKQDNIDAETFNKKTEDINKILEEAQEKGFDIILTALAANNQPDLTAEDLKKKLVDQSEYAYLIQAIVGIEDLDDQDKKK